MNILGLVSLWKFNEGQGTTVDDLVGGNTLNFVGAPTWIMASYGNRNNTYVLSITSPAQKASFVLPENIIAMKSFTLTTWVYFTGLYPTSSQAQQRWLTFGPDCPSTTTCSGARGYGFFYMNGYVTNGPTCLGIINFMSCSIAQWYHLALTWDGSLWVSYLNGMATGNTLNSRMYPLQAGDVFSVTNNGCEGTCSSCKSFAGSGFGGFIGETRFYNVSLSQKEVMSISLM